MTAVPRLLQPKAPRLPAAGAQYDLMSQNQLHNALRVYFNQLDGMSGALLGRNGGQYLDCPNGLFFNTADQTFAAVNTAYPVLFPTAYLTNAVDVNAGTDSRVYVAVSGIYNFQYSGQLVSTNSSTKDVFLWIKRNGVNIGYSTHVYSVSGNGHHITIGWTFNIDMLAGDYLELEIAVTDTTVRLEATAPTAVHPGVPSSVIAVNFIAPVPEVLPTPP